MTPDKEMIAYGACCVWWDDKEKAGTLPGGLPCCPHCKGVLFETPRTEWEKGKEEYAKTHPRYAEFIAWLKGKCFPSLALAELTFNKEVPKP